jgi:predicted phage terminase large subunit-like protein
MRKFKVDGKRVDNLERRVEDLEKARSDSKKKTVRIELDPALNVDCFWSWYASTGWHRKKMQEVVEKTSLASAAEAKRQFDDEARGRVEALHNALRIALAKGWIPHQPSAKQYRFLMLPDKEAFYGGAAGGGKSDALLMGAIMFCQLPDYSAILIRKTLQDLSLSSGLIPRSKRWLKGKARWDGQSHVWRFRSGATITFGYLDSVDDHFRYQSTEFQYVGFDEVTHIPENQSRYLFSRLRRLSSQTHIPLRLRGAGNPEGRYAQYVKSRYVDDETAVAPFVPARIKDNPGLDKESYIDSLSKLDAVTRERLQNGNWEILDQGQMFQPEWFDIVTDYQKKCRKVRYWDKAATAPAPGKDPDYTTGVLMTMKDGVYYIIDVVRFRGTPQVNERNIRKTAERDGIEVEIYMEQEPGSAGKSDIDHYVRDVLRGFTFRGGVRNTGSKVTRAGPLSSAAEHGNVKLVKAAWNRVFLGELALFPIGAHDDQVDAASGAFNKLNKQTPLGGRGVERVIGGQRHSSNSRFLRWL